MAGSWCGGWGLFSGSGNTEDKEMNRPSMMLFLISVMMGCAASSSTMNHTDPIPPGDCKVKVYTSFQEAEKDGEIEELCTIDGMSSGNLSSAIVTTIEKNKHRACECGARNVYLQFQEAGTSRKTSVNLVGFRFVGEETGKK